MIGTKAFSAPAPLCVGIKLFRITATSCAGAASANLPAPFAAPAASIGRARNIAVVARLPGIVFRAGRADILTVLDLLGWLRTIAARIGMRRVGSGITQWAARNCIGHQFAP